MKPGEFVVAAHTGRASHNVGGRTLHSVLVLALAVRYLLCGIYLLMSGAWLVAECYQVLMNV